MGSYVGIGFVYSRVSENQYKFCLQKIVEYLLARDGKINNLKLSADKDGSRWIEKNLTHNSEINLFYGEIIRGYYGQIEMECNLFNISKIELTIRIDADKDYFSFLIDIPEEQLIKAHSDSYLSLITEKIIVFLYDIFKLTKFDYAVCDHETEILYSPSEFKLLSPGIYSIVALPENNKIRIIKSDWHIDGLTKRMI